MMLDIFAQVGTGAVILCAGAAFVGVTALAAWTGPKSLKHPEGRRGRIRDDLIVVVPFAPFLSMLVFGSFMPVLRDELWWTAALFGFAVLAVGGSLLPMVRRARSRLNSLQHNRYPAQ